MVDNEKLYNLIEKMYVDLSGRMDTIDKKLDEKADKSDIVRLDKKLDEKADKTDIVRLENEIKPKLSALFDGYQQNSNKLDRIETEVSHHDKFILERIK